MTIRKPIHHTNMPITASLADLVESYYAAGTSYNNLFLSAFDSAPTDRPRPNPWKPQNKKERKFDTPQSEATGADRKPVPGQIFQDLVNELKKQKVEKPEVEEGKSGEDGKDKKKGKKSNI